MFGRLFLAFLLIIGLNDCFGQLSAVHGYLKNDSNEVMTYQFVWLKGTSQGSCSNENGYFKIKNVRSGSYTLVCAGLSIDTVYIPIKVQDNRDTLIHIIVKEKVQKEDIVVTATRTEKTISDVAIPVKIIGAEEMQLMGAQRLNNVLSEQTGLAIISDHGTGVQLQGLSPEYTLILLNGEPLIGRTAGTFDLTRITVGNIKQVEIVKGPSSSLYGSEALAGVINIITAEPKEKLKINVRNRYGSNNTWTNSIDIGIHHKKTSFYLFADRYSSSGYYLTGMKNKTVPPFYNYTLQTSLQNHISSRLKLTLVSRVFSELQEDSRTIVENTSYYQVNVSGKEYDWNIHPSLTWTINNTTKLISRLYSSRYHTNNHITKQTDGSVLDDSYFNQQFNRVEIQGIKRWSDRFETTVGIGNTLESVNSTRYTDKKSFYSSYLYGQQEASLGKLNVIGGFRYDYHSVYGDQWNPKLSARFKPFSWLSLRASVGTGYKAPEFRQLYLNFTNATAGYSVFGSEEIIHQINQLINQGLITQMLLDPTTFISLKAERSKAINIGWLLETKSKLNWQVNFFRNDIQDMIATSPVAIKTNGQMVYSYYNLSSVFTQGIETELSYKKIKNLTLSSGYQLLIAKDKQVVRDIKDGQYYAIDQSTWITTQVSENQYGGLFNRSRHMLNLRVFYSNPKTGWTFTFRSIYRGRYGYADLNGNLILDIDQEYVPGYWIFNTSASKKINNIITVQGGVDNLMNYTQPSYIPTLPGRLYYGSIQLSFTKK
jgi:outer membrane receptor for ferrienterochelin and colicins